MNNKNLNIKCEKIELLIDGQICETYLSYPIEKKDLPVVFLLMDAFGPRKYLYEVADQLAGNGFFVFLPNLFYRDKRIPIVNLDFPIREENLSKAREIFMPLIHVFRYENALADFYTFFSFLEKRSEVLKSEMKLVGYCLGGGIAIRVNAQFPEKFDRLASFHAGNLVTEDSNSPHRLLYKLKSKLYFAHADNDSSMSQEQIEIFNNYLMKSGASYDSEIYYGAKHGFTMKDLPMYNELALNKHWQKLISFLKTP